MDFKQFMRRVEGKPNQPEVEQFSDEYLYRVSHVHYEAERCQEVLNGDHTRLWVAFQWASTTEGHTYWSAKSQGREPMAPKDYAFIKALMYYNGDRVEA